MSKELQQRASDLIDETFAGRYAAMRIARQEVTDRADLNRETKILVLSCLTAHLFKCAVLLNDEVWSAAYLAEWLEYVHLWYSEIETNHDVVDCVSSLYAEYAAEFKEANKSKG